MYNKIDNIFHASGKSILSGKMNEINFGVYNAQKVTSQSLTEYLDKVYKSDSSFIRLYIKNLDNGEVINQIGELIIQKDSYGIYSYHINQFSIVEKLWDWSDANVSVNIEQVTEGRSFK